MNRQKPHKRPTVPSLSAIYRQLKRLPLVQATDQEIDHLVERYIESNSGTPSIEQRYK